MEFDKRDLADQNRKTTVAHTWATSALTAALAAMLLIAPGCGIDGPAAEGSAAAEQASKRTAGQNQATPSTDPSVAGECIHDVCEEGEPLDPGCDTCATEVCAADPFCCETAWDSVCVNLAEAICGLDCTGGPVCGDGLCELGEDCETCPEDCGECPPPPVCGDGFCEPGESCDTCPADCGECGGDCAHNPCDAGEPLDPLCSDCVNDVCAVDEFCCNETWDSVCVGLAEEVCGLDCGGGPACGDGVCDIDEDCETCPADCGECPPPPPECGDGVCDINEDCETCPADCGECPPPPPECGDGVCDIDEDCETCPADCGECPPPPPECGDGVCDIGEDCETCPADCGECPPPPPCEHELCDTGGPLDPACDSCAADVCAADPFCCDVAWDGICVGLAEDLCGLDCGPAGPECGDGTCEAGESCLTCSTDCGECPPCEHDICETGGALLNGCDFCTPNVCKIDSFCCNFGWDSICVGLAEEHCAVTCDAPLNPPIDPADLISRR